MPAVSDSDSDDNSDSSGDSDSSSVYFQCFVLFSKTINIENKIKHQK
jgi:hypothetical protein